MINRLPVLPPVKTPVFESFEIYYTDSDSSTVKVREMLTLVTEATAAKIARAWNVSTWVKGRVYGYRRVENEK